MVKRIILALFLTTSLTTNIVFGADRIVTIDAWNDYPTPSCETTENNKTRYYLIPRGTKAKVIKWSNLITSGSDKELLAMVSMWEDIEVKIISGPLKGKKCKVKYLYLKLN